MNSLDQLTPLPDHGSCFICGDENPQNLGIKWYRERREDGSLMIVTEFKFDIHQQGPPLHAHGGASAAVLDEAMGVVAWQSGLQVVLANMSLDYRRPIPLDQQVRVEAWVKDRTERKVFTYARLILPDGKTAVSGTGLYVEAAHLFENSEFITMHQFGQQTSESEEAI